MADIVKQGLDAASSEAGATAASAALTSATGVPVPKEAVQAAANVAKGMTSDSASPSPSPSPSPSGSAGGHSSSQGYVDTNMDILNTYGSKMMDSANSLLMGAAGLVGKGLKSVYNYMRPGADSQPSSGVSPEASSMLNQASSPDAAAGAKTPTPTPDIPNIPGGPSM